MLALDNHQTNTCLTIMSVLKLLFFSCCSKIKSPKPVMLRHLFQGCSIPSVYKILNHLGDFHLFFFSFFWKEEWDLHFVQWQNKCFMCWSQDYCSRAFDAYILWLFSSFFFFSFRVMPLKRVKSTVWKGNFSFLKQNVLQEL